jgi:hypothetical protein
MAVPFVTDVRCVAVMLESTNVKIIQAHRVIVWVKTEPEMRPDPVITDTKRL